MPILNVPYFPQPTENTCQSTCLKMMAVYLEERRGVQAIDRDIRQIQNKINTDPSAPMPGKRHNWRNMKWWLEEEFPDGSGYNFRYRPGITRNRTAFRIITRRIQNNLPVMVSTSHARTRGQSGHVIMVIGYKIKTGSLIWQDAGTPTLRNTIFVCHDPFGDFHPELRNRQYGVEESRYMERNPWGRPGDLPGQNVGYSLRAIKRTRGRGSNTFRILWPIAQF